MSEELPAIVPNAEWCEGCPDWDDVNGCWRDFEEYCGRYDDLHGEEFE